MEKEFLNSAKYFKFRHTPFTADASSHSLSTYENQELALQKLLWGIEQRKGILLLSGEEGVGKTFLLDRIEKKVRRDAVLATIRHPPTNHYEFVRHLLMALKLPVQCHRSTSFYQMQKFLQDWILTKGLVRRPVVILIDKAEVLNENSLEFIRLFSNLMTEKERLLTLCLFSRKSFLDSLKSWQQRPLSQRIFLHRHLYPMRDCEVRNYISSCLSAAGGPNEVQFDARALQKIFHLTGGNPRKINGLVSEILSVAEKEKKRWISSRDLEQTYKQFSRS